MDLNKRKLILKSSIQMHDAVFGGSPRQNSFKIEVKGVTVKQQ